MEGFGRDGNTIDIATVQRDWLYSMENIVVENSMLSPKSCIFVTPKLLFRNNKEAYLPTTFSLGPWHHGKPDFEEAELIKLKYTRDLIHRVSQWNANVVDDLVRDIAGLEEEARQCYSVPLKFSRDEFVKVLLVDGCFLIELFLQENVNAPLNTKPFLKEVGGRDILLLENQIPWMVLDRLFSRTIAPGETSQLISRALRYLCRLGAGLEDLATESLMQNTLERNKHMHIVDLLRNALVRSTMKKGGIVIMNGIEY